MQLSLLVIFLSHLASLDLDLSDQVYSHLSFAPCVVTTSDVLRPAVLRSILGPTMLLIFGLENGYLICEMVLGTSSATVTSLFSLGLSITS